MRDRWGSAPALNVDPARLGELVAPAFPDQSVVACVPLAGGLANATLRLQLSRRAGPVVLRFFVRDPGAAAKEVAVLRALAGRVPVPEVLHFAPENPLTGHPYVLLEWVEGERLERVAPGLAGEELDEVGRSVGGALAAIHATTFPATGFLDHHLEVVERVDVGARGLVDYLRACLLDGQGSRRLGADLARALIAFAESEGPLLDRWNGPPCLVHSDFGGSNILVRHTAAGWRTVAVVDWEFAFSGSPFFDLGNLLRPPLGQLPAFAGAVAGGYAARGGVLPADWRRMSYLADLSAWAEFLSRPQLSAALIADARAAIRATLRAFGR